LGCSDSEYETVTYREARDVSPDFNWLANFAMPLFLFLGITLAVALCIYGIIRAIGWVIGGFAAP
jgi:hypothetical protein